MNYKPGQLVRVQYHPFLKKGQVVKIIKINGTRIYLEELRLNANISFIRESDVERIDQQLEFDF